MALFTFPKDIFVYVLLEDLLNARSIASQKPILIFANAEVPGVTLANLATSVPSSVLESGMARGFAD